MDLEADKNISEDHTAFNSRAEDGTLRIKAIRAAKTLISAYKSTRSYNSDDQHLRRQENLKNIIFNYFLFV